MLDKLLGSGLLEGFTASPQGRDAVKVLSQKLSGGQVDSVLREGLAAAGKALTGQAQSAKGGKGAATAPELGLFDLLGGHPGQAFLVGTTTSLLKGEGFVDAMQDGAFSIVGAHVTEVIASRVGLDRQMAAWAGAALTPFVVSYVQEKLGNDSGVQAQRGKPLTALEIQQRLDGKLAAAMQDPTSAASRQVIAEAEARTQRALAAKAGGAAPVTKGAPPAAKGAAPAAKGAAPAAAKGAANATKGAPPAAKNAAPAAKAAPAKSPPKK